jgi:DNA-binding transcriptional ArsR family regulator
MKATSIENIAGLIGEAGRIQMLMTLLDGQSHSAGELAVAANASAQVTSAHLAKLMAGGLIAVQSKGRQRLFRLKSPEVAVAVEALGALVPKPANAVPELCLARTCYDHLAGALAIALRNRMTQQEFLFDNGRQFVLSRSGERFLGAMDIGVAPLRKLRRAFACRCMDWTERNHHIGGALGAAMLSHFLEAKWLARMRNTRAVRITIEGEQMLERVFQIRWAALRSQAGNS